MLLNKIPHLKKIKENFDLVLQKFNKENKDIEELKIKVEKVSDELQETKNSIVQKDILLVNLFKELENLKQEKQSIENDLLSLVSAIGSLHVIVENYMINEYDINSSKKKIKYH